MTRAVFLDRDGVINVDHGYVCSWEHFDFLPGVIDALRELQDAGFLLIIVTNQSGIGRGLYNEEDLDALNQQIDNHLIRLAGVRISGFYHCPHHPTEAKGKFLKQCECRKPAPGMINQAAQDHGINLCYSLLVGDKDSDLEAGKAAGVGRLFKVSSSPDTGSQLAEATVVAGLNELPSLLQLSPSTACKKGDWLATNRA